MDRKGVVDTPAMRELLYFILLAAFFITYFVTVGAYKRGDAGLEDVYAKEISRIIDSVPSGTKVTIDVTPAVTLAFSSGKARANEIFIFDNLNKEIIVSLKEGQGSRFSFLRNVTVVDSHVELISGGIDSHKLVFTVK